jgi:hypothetical protein
MNNNIHIDIKSNITIVKNIEIDIHDNLNININNNDIDMNNTMKNAINNIELREGNVWDRQIERTRQKFVLGGEISGRDEMARAGNLDRVPCHTA